MKVRIYIYDAKELAKERYEKSASAAFARLMTMKCDDDKYLYMY